MLRRRNPGSALPRGEGRAGATFTEILVAAGIMAAAFVPIAGYINHSMKLEREEKMESGISSFVNAKMSEWLTTRTWDQVTNGGATEYLDREGTKIEVQWTVTVTDVMNGASTFQFNHVKYHKACGSGTEAGGATGTLVNTPPDNTLQVLDKESATGTGSGVYLRDIELMVRWRWPGSQWDDVRRREFFLTRRARLK